MRPSNFFKSLKEKSCLLEQIIFYLLLLFLPTQLGKHFWPESSFVSGIRIDYLSPTIYLTDVLIFILFVFWLSLRIRELLKNLKLNSILVCKPLFIIIFLLIGILLSKNPIAGLYGLIKLVEFIFLGLYIKKEIKTKKFFGKVLFVLALGILFESLLAIAQYLGQGSINGAFYFLGERNFNVQTPGIANASLNGELILRPYATFSHPNVLAGYLLIIMTMIASSIKQNKTFFITMLIIGSLALFLTMSRVAIVLWIVTLFFKFKNSLKISNLKFQILTTVLIGIIGSIFLLSPLRFRFNIDLFNDESFLLRMSLIKSSILIIKDNPVFGVGINNFLVNLPFYQTENSFQALFQNLQPVHNIYLLIMSEIGVFGFVFVLLFIFKTLIKVKNTDQNLDIKNSLKISNFKFQILLLVLVLGLFDHYFLTIQQGQLLLTLVIALSFVKFDEKLKERDNI